jgi:hypothetical protein
LTSREIPVNNGVLVAAVAALAIGVTAGCSSGPAPFKPKRGVLPPGTAQLTIDGKDAGNTGAVQCGAVEWLTTIKIGDDSAGATVLVSNAGELTVELVRIRNIDGFTGDYNLNLEGDAAVALTGATYHITGTALGYGPTAIAPTTQPFKIGVAC